MPRVGFDPTIPVFERAKAFHALDHAAVVIGFLLVESVKYIKTLILLSKLCTEVTVTFRTSRYPGKSRHS
jgi:hypothetical protein